MHFCVTSQDATKSALLLFIVTDTIHLKLLSAGATYSRTSINDTQGEAILYPDTPCCAAYRQNAFKRVFDRADKVH